MNMKPSTHLKFKRMFVNFLSIFIVLAMAFPAVGSASAQEPAPWLIAFPEWDSVEGYDWPLGAVIHLAIDDPATEASPDHEQDETAVVTPWGAGVYVKFNFWGTYDLKPADIVTLTYDQTTQTHIVQNLSVTAADVVADTVAGTADEGAIVRVNPYDDWGIVVEAITSAGGIWLADFAAVGFDLPSESGGRSQIFVGDNATAVDWSTPSPPPNPHFTVFPEWEWFDGLDWPDGAIVSIGVEGKPECGLERESWGGFFNGNFPQGCDLEIGDTVTFDDGTTNRTHIVRNLAITEVAKDANTVAGTADEGTTVYVWPHDGWFEPLQVTANALNEWQVDLGDVGYDIQEGKAGRSEIRDDLGNATAVDWYVPNPHFTVFPEWEFFDGLEWPDGATVSITVAGKSECDTTKESWGYFFNGNFGEGCDIVFGDEVTFTDGDTVRTHTVRNLSVTKVDRDDDIVKGVADAGAEVYVWPHATGQEQLVTTNSNGKWNVDFTGIYDLAIGDGGRAEIRDETGNATAVDWYISQPRFTIFPDAQWFDGMDWPDGATVTITVKDKPECTFTRESWGGFFNGGFPEGCLVTAGDRVTFTDGTTIRKQTVQNLAIIMVDKDANTVAGIAETGAVVHTWVWGSDGSTLDGSNLEVTAVYGAWLADFGALGIDLEIGMGIQAEIRDENGNATSVDLPVPDPRIVASITEDWFYLADFIPGSTLDLSVYENQGGNIVWQGTRTADVNGFAWIDAEGWNLEPGNYLVVSDGNTSKDLVIEGFTFDVFDLINGQLSGTAPEPYGRRVWVGIGFENDGWSMDITTDETGAWFADFGQPVPSDYQWVAAQIFDDDGNASELRPAQIISE